MDTPITQTGPGGTTAPPGGATTPPGGTTTPSGGTPNPIATRIQAIQQGLRGLIDDCKAQFQVDLSVDLNLSGVWFNDVPKLSLACADIYQVLSSYFEEITFTPDDLRNLEEQVRQMDEFIAYIAAALTELGQIFAYLRKQLAERAQGIVDQFQALKAQPYLAKDKKSEVTRYSAPIDKILADRKAAVKGTKTTNLKQRTLSESQLASKQAELDSKTQEVNVLRGGSLSAPAQATPQKAKSKRRSTPRSKTAG